MRRSGLGVVPDFSPPPELGQQHFSRSFPLESGHILILTLNEIEEPGELPQRGPIFRALLLGVGDVLQPSSIMVVTCSSVTAGAAARRCERPKTPVCICSALPPLSILRSGAVRNSPSGERPRAVT